MNGCSSLGFGWDGLCVGDLVVVMVVEREVGGLMGGHGLQ